MQEIVQLKWLNKFLHSELNVLIQHIIVQDHDGLNNNTFNMFFYLSDSIPKPYSCGYLEYISVLVM